MTTDAEQPAGPAAPDANASPQPTAPEGEPTATGSEAAPSPAVTDPDEKPTPKGFGKRIDELTRNWRETERREQALLEILKQRQPEPAQPAQSGPKTLADFEYDEAKYQAHLFQQAEERAVSAAEKRLKEQQERDAAERRRSTFNERETKFASTAEDYYEKTRDPRVPITPAIAEVLGESEDGPALAYYLASNLAIADQISRLPLTAAARELGRIEAKLAFEREKAAIPRVSQAPAPPPKLEGTSSQVDKDPTQMSDAEFEKWFRKKRGLKSA